MWPALCAVCEMEDDGAPPARVVGAGFAWIVLPRHGRRPLGVCARALLRADNRCAALPCWSEIGIHETIAGRLVVSLCHRSPDDAGPPWRDAFLCADSQAVRSVFRAHDPLWALPTCVAPTASAANSMNLQRFRLAWAGLLGAVFGLDPGSPPP